VREGIRFDDIQAANAAPVASALSMIINGRRPILSDILPIQGCSKAPGNIIAAMAKAVAIQLRS
jgi:hypothetical protein